ncbi:unnamed protein product [Rotaria sordida]|uniref:Uncharacterized protein n=1 Tax=Rotaria sordida TaxID=392033 RepID=A0A815GKI9_9BILA|nr:unnamed protein product [Rotaria sordida]CAF1596863.1 unnamed protein product [Rotaria sordida]
MLNFDQQSVPKIDSLCSLRAYIHYCSIACIHHSLILQALEKYLKVRRIMFLNSQIRKMGIVLIQWIFDFTFTLPIFLTGNMVKMIIDNLCFISLSRLDLLLYTGVTIYILSDIVLAVIYRLLVRLNNGTSHCIDKFPIGYCWHSGIAYYDKTAPPRPYLEPPFTTTPSETSDSTVPTTPKQTPVKQNIAISKEEEVELPGAFAAVSINPKIKKTKGLIVKIHLSSTPSSYQHGVDNPSC